MKRRLSTSPPPSSRSRSSYTIDPFSSTSLTQSESISNYKLGKVIGQGTSATVILAEHTTTKKPYVIKSFKNPQRSKANLHQRIQQEVKIFKRICESDHPFIVKFRGFILNENEISIILEYINGLNLLQKLETNGPFNESQAKFYITEIATGISFLHSKRIIHRDLKLDNMMISNDGHIKLIDFGLSEILQGSQTHLSIPSGAMHIRPPEMIRREPYSFNVDWYALGVALYELLTDHEPFFRRNCYLHQIEPSSNSEPSLTIKGCPDECLPRMILETGVIYPSHLSINCIDLIKLLINKNHTQRLQNISELIHHPWFNKVNWNKVSQKQSIPPRFRLPRACKKIRI